MSMVSPFRRRRQQQFRRKSQTFTFHNSEPPHLRPSGKEGLVPNVITMFHRYLFLLLVQIAWMIFSAVIIMGEDVLFRFAFVDLIYSNIGTNPNDVWTFVYISGMMIIWGVGAFWAVGAFGLLSNLLDGAQQ